MSNQFKEYEVVEVIQKNSSVPEAEIGDRGTVLMILESASQEIGYEVECVRKDGSTKWLGTFQKKHLKSSTLFT
jgi:hypothetical protein